MYANTYVDQFLIMIERSMKEKGSNKIVAVDPSRGDSYAGVSRCYRMSSRYWMASEYTRGGPRVVLIGE